MLKKILKYMLYAFIILGLCVAGMYAYISHNESVEKNLELSFHTKHKWEWENEYSGVQIRFVEDAKRSVLRKVHTLENYVIYAYKNDDYTLSTVAVFPTTCKPNKIITTTEKFPNGEPKTLNCDEDGESLVYQAIWTGKDPIMSWSENLNGYKIEESFFGWNFDKLDREITLNKAK